MLAMAPPVTSRNAAIISSLARQNPISSAAVIVPAKARVNNDTFTITFRLISLSRNDGAPDCCIMSLPGSALRLQLGPQAGQQLFQPQSDGSNAPSPPSF